MRLAALLLVAGCWWGPAHPVEPLADAPPAPAPAPRIDIDVTMERTACMGWCPEYSVELDHDGTVVWHGIANVAVLGTVRAHISPRRLVALEHALSRARFFELDANGQLPSALECTHTGNTTSCTLSSVVICTDTSHAIVTVRRPGTVHTVDDARCGDQTALSQLEDLIDRLAGSRDRIGGALY